MTKREKMVKKNLAKGTRGEHCECGCAKGCSCGCGSQTKCQCNLDCTCGCS